MRPIATIDPGIGLPATMRTFVLDGQGPEHAGIRRLEMPRPDPGQLVGRVDAAGICSSVTKVVDQGSAPSLMHGWDLAAHPAILGDEGVITVAAVRAGNERRAP
jgi:NADPH:quinone reductase-like Zn-dependent oxidoreductase